MREWKAPGLELGRYPPGMRAHRQAKLPGPSLKVKRMAMLRDQSSRAPRGVRGGNVGVQIAFWAILLLGALARLTLYGDPRLSIATLDTQSYVDSSRASLLSTDVFSGRRLPTTNMVFKLVSGNSNCGQITVSMPAVGKEGRRDILPCFESVALLQSILSILGWLWLAFVLARHLTTATMKLLAAGVIILFAFTPQIAEWDSILASESLTLSLFAISLGLLIEAAFAWRDASRRPGRLVSALCVVWFIFFVLWVFVRDANILAIPVTLVLLAPVFFSRRLGIRSVIGVLAILLIVLFVFGWLGSRQSSRWQPSIQDSLRSWIFPYPGRVQYMSQHFAMPDPASAAFPFWFEHRAPTAYSTFLVSHPGFIVTTVMDNWLVFYHSYEQPYFPLAKTTTNFVLAQLGDVVHPGSAMIYLIDTLALVAFWAGALRGRAHQNLVWAWMFTWLFLTAGITLLLSYFGDADGSMRHIFPSLEMFRLLAWLSVLIFADAHIGRPEQAPVQPTILASSDQKK